MSTSKQRVSVCATMFLALGWIGAYNVGYAGETVSIGRVDSITVDGKMQDWPWPSTSSMLFEDQQAVVDLCRNSDYLYVMLRFTIKDYARSIGMGGLKVYLDPKGKKSKDFRISYFGNPEGIGPGGNPPAAPPPARGDSAMRAPAEQGQSQPPTPTENRLTVFRKGLTEETAVRADGTDGPAAACGLEKGFYVYEFRVPYREGIDDAFGLAADSSRPLGVGIVWGGTEGARTPGPPGEEGGFGAGGGMGEGPDAGGPPGMGGSPGGGGPGGMGEGPGSPGGPEGAATTTQKQEIWFKAVAAAPAAEGKR
jgi:hypothetical protein